MNKKIILILLLFIPFLVNAKSCDSKAHAEYTDLAPNITYETSYSKSEDKYTVILYNIIDGMYAKYDKNKYEADSNDQITITGIKPGTVVNINIFADDGCDEIKIISEVEPYYNEFYGSAECIGYEDKIPACKFQFTNSKITRELFEEEKNNYGQSIQSVPGQKPEEPKETILTKVKNFVEKWGIKIILVVVTIFVTSTIYNAKFRNIKHGI